MAMSVMEREVKLLKALADETRIRIVQCLLNGNQCACALVPLVGRAQPTVSQHLRILQEAGVLRARREGVNIRYEIGSEEAIQIMEILHMNKIEAK